MRVIAAVVGLVMGWGCGGGEVEVGEAPAAGAEPQVVHTAAAPAETVDEPVDMGPDSVWTVRNTVVERNGAEAVILRDVRTARHEGFDRIVLEFDGPVPGYRLEYIDRPVRQCGSGDVVPLAGDGWLEIALTPAHAHTEAGAPTIQDRQRRPDLPNLKELKLTCDFEAHVNWVAGVGSPNRYRVLELREPARLVVDIRH